MSNTVRFNITPGVSLVDTPVRIKLEGLLPHQGVTIRVRRPSTNPGISLESYGVFRSDGEGIVDVQTQSPVEGTYSEADGMGLFWSMQRIETPTTQKQGSSTPLSPLIFTFTAECEGK